MGYGFYINVNKELYVKVCIWGEELYVSLMRRGGNCLYDIVNDVEVKTTKQMVDLKIVEKVTLEYLEYAKTLEPTYKIELTESELKSIINLVDEKLKEKLNSYLQNK